MASLNLTPNPSLILAHAAVFLANTYVIKKLMLEPFLALKQDRDSKTVGGQAEADKLFEEANKLNNQIEEKRRVSRESAMKMMAATKAQAEAESQKLFSKTQSELEEYLADFRNEFAAEVAREERKLPDLVDELAESAFQAVVK